MKSTSIIFITFNSINKHLSHALQMHTHAYIQRVHDSEPYSGIQGRRKCLWTLVDPDMYMCRVDIFPYYSLYFSFLIISQKTLSSPISSTIIWQTFPIITASCMTSPPYILLFTPPSPVIYKDFFPFVYMYKSSRYYAVFHIDLDSIFPWSTSLKSLDTGSTTTIKHFGYYCQWLPGLTTKSIYCYLYLHYFHTRLTFTTEGMDTASNAVLPVCATWPLSTQVYV